MEPSVSMPPAKDPALTEHGPRLSWQRFEPWLVGVTVMVVWQVIISAGWANGDLFSSPVEMVKSGVRQFSGWAYWGHVLHSARMFLVGIGSAAVVGISLGLIVANSEPLREMLDPVLMLVYTLPREALIPLLIIWFGIGVLTESIVSFLGAFFPVFFNTVTGVRTVDPNLVRAARAFCANRWDIFRVVLLPGALPAIMTGIRLGIGRAVMGVVVAEMYMSIAGLGSLIIRSQAGMNVDRMLFNTFVVSILGFLAVQGAKWVERRFSYIREGVA